jgi:hypothetical protein
MFDIFSNPERVKSFFFDPTPGFVASSNPRLKLANAFGVILSQFN